MKLLEGPSARLPAGWQFTDLQLEPYECFRVSASHPSTTAGNTRLKELLAIWLGRLVSGEGCKDLFFTEMRRENFQLGTLVPSLGHLWRGAVKLAKIRCCSYETIWQQPSPCTTGSLRPEGSLEPCTHCWPFSDRSPSRAPV